MRYDIIKTTDYLLICDDSYINNGVKVLYNNRDILTTLQFDTWFTKWDFVEKIIPPANYIRNCKKIIAHLPINGAPILDGVPVLPQLSNHREDKDYSLSAAKEFAKSHFENLYEKYPLGGKVAIKNIMNVLEVGVECGHKFGYKEAREKYKFTEDDMIKFADFKSSNLMKHSDENGMYLGTRKVLELWKSLQQPKYPIAFECDIEPEYTHIGSTKEVKGSGDRIKNKNAGKPKTIIASEGRVEWVGKYIYE